MILLLFFPSLLQCMAICDLKLLQMELKQDLEDNGILDCLRIVEPPEGVDETPKEKNLRLAAQWDTDCSFEADYDWLSQLRENYSIYNLVYFECCNDRWMMWATLSIKIKRTRPICVRSSGLLFMQAILPK